MNEDGADTFAAAYMGLTMGDVFCVQVVCSTTRGTWKSKSAAGARLQVHLTR